MIKKIVLFSFIAALCTSCFQAYSNGDDDELSTIPITNNPNIVPNHGSSLPGM